MPKQFLRLILLLCLIISALSCGKDDGDDSDIMDPEPTDTLMQFVDTLPTFAEAAPLLQQNWRLMMVGQEESLDSVEVLNKMCFDEFQYTYNFENAIFNHDTYKLWDRDEGYILTFNEGSLGTTDYQVLHLKDQMLKIKEVTSESGFVYLFAEFDGDCE